jgi:hypothetical protein
VFLACRLCYYIVAGCLVRVLGDSIVHWAGQWLQRQTGDAICSGVSVREIVQLRGCRGANIQQFKSFLMEEWSRSPTIPAVVVVHVGTNNLLQTPARELREQLDGLWTLLRCVSDETHFVWSDILPRRDVAIGGPRDRIRKGINRFGRRLALRNSGGFVPHPDISAADSSLFRPDGIHLSEIGHRMFVRDILLHLRQAHPTI